MRKLFFGLLFVLLACRAMAADEWLKTRPASTDTRISWPADSQANNAAIDRLLANYREGMTMTYSSATTISVTAGSITCSNAAGTVRKMRLNTSATNVTFSDIDAGSEASGTTYYIYANCDADAETATFKISASSTVPTGVTYYKRLGSFYNDSSSNITTITNDNNVYASGFGAWTSKSSGVTYQALTDGVVTAYNSLSGTYVQIFGYTDSSSSPTTLRAGGGPPSDQSFSITFPVKKMDYYKVTGADAVYFLPLNN